MDEDMADAIATAAHRIGGVLEALKHHPHAVLEPVPSGPICGDVQVSDNPGDRATVVVMPIVDFVHLLDVIGLVIQSLKKLRLDANGLTLILDQFHGCLPITVKKVWPKLHACSELKQALVDAGLHSPKQIGKALARLERQGPIGGLCVKRVGKKTRDGELWCVERVKDGGLTQ